MSYDVYLIAMGQLAGRKKARLLVEEKEIFLENLGEGHWKFSARVFTSDGDLPSELRSCLFRNGVLRWQERGTYLKYDTMTESILLIYEVEMEPGKYIPFRQALTSFMRIAHEWIDTLEEISHKDSIYAP